MANQLTDLKDAHGNRVLIGRALVKALARMAKVLMGSLNLTAGNAGYAL